MNHSIGVSSVYNPNFRDPRTINRCKMALGFVYAHIRPKFGRNTYCRDIDRNCGRVDTDIGRYLRRHLLIESNSWFSMDKGICKQYTRNEPGIERIMGSIGQVYSPDAQYHNMRYWGEAVYGTQLKSGVFEYTRGPSSNRYYHPLQNLRRESRRDLFLDYGYAYQYDIASCAPTTLYQSARRVGCDALETIHTLLTNKAQFRRGVAERTGISVSDVKIMITMMFSGAPFKNAEGSAYHNTCSDPQRLPAFFDDAVIGLLKADIKQMWSALVTGGVINKGYTTNPLTGRKRRDSVKCKDKWAVYHGIETQITSTIKQYLAASHNPCFLIHDGYYTKHSVNTQELEQRILQETNYLVKLE